VKQSLRKIGVAVIMVAWSTLLAAQAAGRPAASPPPSPAATTPQPPPAEPYTYNPDGRRDPFVSLVARGAQPVASGTHVEGLSNLSTAEMVLSGIIQSRSGLIALVKAPDGKTFRARVNDKLADGTIRSITLQGMVIMQEVNDPLSLVKVKEVRKGLRAADDVKQ
jgi:Tfp pilus assembly protein PilP